MRRPSVQTLWENQNQKRHPSCNVRWNRQESTLIHAISYVQLWVKCSNKSRSARAAFGKSHGEARWTLSLLWETRAGCGSKSDIHWQKQRYSYSIVCFVSIPTLSSVFWVSKFETAKSTNSGQMFISLFILTCFETAASWSPWSQIVQPGKQPNYILQERGHWDVRRVDPDSKCWWSTLDHVGQCFQTFWKFWTMEHTGAFSVKTLPCLGRCRSSCAWFVFNMSSSSCHVTL